VQPFSNSSEELKNNRWSFLKLLKVHDLSMQYPSVSTSAQYFSISWNRPFKPFCQSPASRLYTWIWRRRRILLGRCHNHYAQKY
jgi:hypothetical protein